MENIETEIIDNKSEVAWFVGANIEDEDQTQKFIREGIWEHGYADKYINLVKSIKVGDKIAIKTSYTKKNNLPFDNKENTVAVMGIKAIGIVKKNYNDGKKLSVDWKELNPIKEWYFFTYRPTIWKVDEEKGWMYKSLIDFTFNNCKQDINRFMNDPYWESRFGNNNKYEWTSFYESTAKALLRYKDNRSALISEINEIFKRLKMRNPLVKSNEDEKGLNDVCPFTVLGLFNKGIKDENRILIMKELAKLLDIKEVVPTSFDGIPVLNNMNTWFFGDEEHRDKDDIENLWNLFEVAIKFAEDYTEENRSLFIENYNKVINQYGIKWNITFGLYWIKPWDYVTLDTNTRTLLTEKLQVNIPSNSLIAGEEYLELIENLKEKFNQDDYPVHSFPELSFKAWVGVIKIETKANVVDEDKSGKYTKEDFLEEVFIDKEKYERIRSILERKKNIILQGAPGVGKTFAAERLAFSIMGEKDKSRVKMIQFHQSYSYEDFIMGYRPNGTGFELKEGPFYKFCKEAEANKDKDYYFIIDEINRGNMSKIFGELMMLIESDKRGKELTLTYSDSPFNVPENLYIIGMMNTADRSLAIIDYALRRRFCFIQIDPAFDTEIFKKHLLSQGASDELIEQIRSKIGNINSEISNDINLGNGFRIGHSYFCNYINNETWYEEIIRYEIAPLIQEYWFDEEEKAKKYIEELLR